MDKVRLAPDEELLGQERSDVVMPAKLLGQELCYFSPVNNHIMALTWAAISGSHTGQTMRAILEGEKRSVSNACGM